MTQPFIGRPVTSNALTFGTDIPSWADDPKIGYSMINARAESVAMKPAYRSAFKKGRCLIVADGFYEWKKVGSLRMPIEGHYFKRIDA